MITIKTKVELHQCVSTKSRKLRKVLQNLKEDKKRAIEIEVYFAFNGTPDIKDVEKFLKENYKELFNAHNIEY